MKRKIKNKKPIILALSIFTIASVAATLSILATKNETKQKDVIQVSELDNITLTNKKYVSNADGSTTLSVNYTISPSDVTGYTFDGYLSWASLDSATYEYETWYENKNPEDYMSFTINENLKQIALTCSEAFGHTMNFTLLCKENTTIKASLSIDYVRKLITPGKAVIENPQLEDNKSINIVETLPIYTVGTKGEIARDIQLSYEFRQGANYFKYDDLMPTIDLTGFYETKTAYYDVNVSNVFTCETLDTIRKKMIENSRNYILSVITSNGSVIFSKEKLINMLSYKKAGNPYSGLQTYNDIAVHFFNNYKTLYSNGGGYRLTVKYNGTETDSQRIGFGFNSTDNFNLSLSNLRIEF